MIRFFHRILMRPSLKYCIDLVRKSDHSSYLTTLFSPHPARDFIFALKAFNIQAAQIQDLTSTSAIAAIRLQFWRDLVESVWAGKGGGRDPIGTELAAGLQLVGGPRAISKRFLDSILDERHAHLSRTAFDSLETLESFAAGTQTSLHYMHLEALGVIDSEAESAVAHLGKAMGIATVLRGTGFHLSKRSCFIPSFILQKVFNSVYHSMILLPKI